LNKPPIEVSLTADPYIVFIRLLLLAESAGACSRRDSLIPYVTVGVVLEALAGARSLLVVAGAVDSDPLVGTVVEAGCPLANTLISPEDVSAVALFVAAG